MVPTHRHPTHPGEVLLEEFLKPLHLSQVSLASKMGISLQRLNTLINERRDITAETALLLARELKTSPEFWMNLQAGYDLYEARKSLKLAA